MHSFPLALFAAASLTLSGTALAKAPSCAKTGDAAVAGLFDQWNAALATNNPDKVADRYWPDAVLLPTVSNTPRTDRASIRAYFVDFLQKHPQGKIDTRTIKINCNTAVDMGTYTFTLQDKDGHSKQVAARYTYVYENRGGSWKILHHHSSAMPEAVTK
ncbi:SgcJ/EcaC family oxidoreductase [Jeongeupia wiesaeckerbachi]|uniref:SgcJ/EcaC family oxidoreductase n=1 Tax=Jeongeupia wiesaeckerbachi TaxID=3051218 RepID=UPI003D8006B5